MAEEVYSLFVGAMEGLNRMSLQQMGGIGDLLIDAIERHGNRVAFQCEDSQYTYSQLGDDVARTIAFFAESGLNRGDRVAQIAANSYEMFVVIAAAYIGGYASLALQYDAEFDDHVIALEDMEPTLLFVDDQRMQRASELMEASSCKLRVVNHSSLRTLFAEKKRKAAPIASYFGQTDPESVARINQTGGTSGRPKAVMISSAALAFNTLSHVAVNAFDGDTRLLVASPISHGGGSFIPPVLAKGGRIVIKSKFRPGDVIEEVVTGKVNTLFMVPTMMYALMDHPEAVQLRPGQLKRVIYGAAPSAPKRVRQAMEMFGPVLLQSYGLSEAPGTILYLSPEDHQYLPDDQLTSAGRPYPGVIVQLRLDGEEVPLRSGEVGEICVRAPHVMLGYWNAPRLTEEVFADGWLHTGDLARVDEHGFFHIVSRLKDMIISGGVNVYASEVEQALEQHDAVKTSAVIGLPDPKWGEVVTGFVVRSDGATIADDELIAFVRKKKGPVKSPKSIIFLDALPLTKVGKVDKQALRSDFWKGLERQIN